MQVWQFSGLSWLVTVSRTTARIGGGTIYSSPARHRASASLGHAGQLRGALVKVLLADDDVDHLDMVGYILRREGFVVSVATDGRDALKAWEDEQPDILLLDLRMPSVNGFDVLRTVR